MPERDKIMATILLVEDDVNIVYINRAVLVDEGYTVYSALTASDCQKILAAHTIDLVVMDINLPDGNGIDLCRSIRHNYNLPILFLTALDENSDIIKGLDAGAYDYLTKPYDLGVFLARIKTRLRDLQPNLTTTLSIDKLHLEMIASKAFFDGEDLLLTKHEFFLLWLLIEKRGQTIGRDELVTKIWGCSESSNYNALRVLVSRVKIKLANIGAPFEIITKRSTGYMLQA